MTMSHTWIHIQDIISDLGVLLYLHCFNLTKLSHAWTRLNKCVPVYGTYRCYVPNRLPRYVPNVVDDISPKQNTK